MIHWHNITALSWSIRTLKRLCKKVSIPRKRNKDFGYRRRESLASTSSPCCLFAKDFFYFLYSRNIMTFLIKLNLTLVIFWLHSCNIRKLFLEISDFSPLFFLLWPLYSIVLHNHTTFQIGTPYLFGPPSNVRAIWLEQTPIISSLRSRVRPQRSAVARRCWWNS